MSFRKRSEMHIKNRRIIKMLLCCLAFAIAIVMRTGAADAAETQPSVDPVGHKENYSAVLYDNTNGLPISEGTISFRQIRALSG